MHPHPTFAWDDEAALFDFIALHPFATIALPAPGIVHAPVAVIGGELQFHLARRNRMIGEIEGKPVVASILGRHGYQSANWYVSEDQVPTWHYEAVEIEGTARRLAEEELVAQVDALTEMMETRYQPTSPWSRDKMKEGGFEAMVKAIIGFAVPIAAMRGTRKFNQHKDSADHLASLAGLRGAGLGAVAEALEEARA